MNKSLCVQSIAKTVLLVASSRYYDTLFVIVSKKCTVAARHFATVNFRIANVRNGDGSDVRSSE